MDSLTTPCVFCGTDRPIASEVCPSCGRGWIDELIPHVPAQPEPPEEAAAADDEPAAAVVPPASEGPETPREPDHEDRELPSPVAPIAAATAVFSDSTHTGLHEDPTPDVDGAEDMEAVAAPSADPLALSDDDEILEAAAGVPLAPGIAAVPTNAEPGIETAETEPEPQPEPDPIPDATSSFAAVVPSETVDEPASVDSADEPEPEPEPEPETEPEPEPEPDPDAEPEPDPIIDFEPPAPDELGILPVITATGPPGYLPEPPIEDTPSPIVDPDAAAPEVGVDHVPPSVVDGVDRVDEVIANGAQSAPAQPPDAPTAPTDPEAAAVEEVDHVDQLDVADGPDERGLGPAVDFEPPAPDELGILPVITAAGPPEYLPEPPAVPPASTGSAPEPVAPAAPAADVPAAPDVTEAAETPEPDARERDLGAAAAGVAAAAAATASTSAIDPDRLIDDVFGDDLVDGRPPSASDEMLDDETAWSAFAPPSKSAPPPAGTGPPAAAPPPSTIPYEFAGEHPDESDFFDQPAPATRREARAAAVAATGEQATESPAPVRKGRWSQTAIVAGIVLGIVAAWFVVLSLITRDSGDETAAPGSIGSVTAPTVAGTDAPGTTIASATTAATTSTTTSTTLAFIEPVGDPIPLGDLGLGAFALGPIDFNTSDALGRLVATFDQPDSIVDVGGQVGLCPDDSGFTANWGPFAAIFLGAPETNLFAGYRLDAGDPDHPTSSLATISGLQLGDSIADLRSTYVNFDISFEEFDGQLSFILGRQSDSATLLWGPVTSSDPDGIVEGIYSPQACDGGPTPSG